MQAQVRIAMRDSRDGRLSRTRTKRLLHRPSFNHLRETRMGRGRAFAPASRITILGFRCYDVHLSMMARILRQIKAARLPHVTALVVAACLLGSFAEASSKPHETHQGAERFGPRPPSSLLCEQQAWPLPVDGALCAAARLLTSHLEGFEDPTDGHRESTASLIQETLRSQGVADAHVRARVIRSPSYGKLYNRMESLVEEMGTPASHLGMSIAPSEEDNPWGILLVARRLVHIDPFPANLEANDELSVNARLGRGTSRPQAWLGLEGGPVEELPLTTTEKGFRVRSEPLPAGRHTLQILVEAGMGPEVALIAPIQVGPPLTSQCNTRDFEITGDETAAIHQAITDHRRRLGLAFAKRDSTLDLLATERAKRIASIGRPVHRPGPKDDVATMLSDRGYPYAWAAENLAAGPSAASAFTGLLDSPAHRRLIEHERARRVGVAVNKKNQRTWVAVIIADPMDARPAVSTAGAARVVAARLLHRAQDALNETRRLQGRPAATRDPALDSVALELAEHLASIDRPDDPEARARARRLALEADTFAITASAEVVVAGRPEDLVQAPAAVRGDCDRLGLGVAAAKSERFGGERLWLTAVCAHRGGRR